MAKVVSIKKSVKKLIKNVTEPQKKRVTKKKKVPSTAKGYHSITPFLVVKNVLKTIAFYKKAFGAKEVMVVKGQKGKIMHAELQIGDSKFMLAEECPEMKTSAPKANDNSGISLYVYVNNVDAVVKKAVASGAKLTQPIENMFYGDRCGGVRDPFGYRWCVATHVEQVTPAMIKKRMAQMMDKK